MTKVKWLIYTVLLGATPIFTRLLIRFVAAGDTQAPWINEADIIAFGLVLAITNISGLEHSGSIDDRKRTTNIGFSLLLVVLLVSLFAASCLNDIATNVVDMHKIRLSSLVLATTCLIYSYAIWDRLLALRISREESHG